MIKRIPEEWEDAVNLVARNICDTRKFLLIRRKFDNVLMAHKNFSNLFVVHGNAINCATIITFYKVVENGEKKSLVFLLRRVIKELDKKQCDYYKIGSKVKIIDKIRKRIRPLRDRVWAHGLDFKKPNQEEKKGSRKDIDRQEIDAYVSQTEQYFNEIIEIFKNAGYFVSNYKINPDSLKKLETEIDKFLNLTIQKPMYNDGKSVKNP
ncbi:MAG: hypothetical protein V2A64_01880 [Candidatus Omnitrophota bacterium]